MGFLSNLFSRSSPTDPLDALLAEASREPSKREEFYHALLDATLLVPGEIMEGELFVRPYTVENRKSLLIFTAPDQASSLRDHPPLVEMKGEILLRAGLGFDGVALNYGNRNEKWFTAPELRALLDGSIFGLLEYGSSGSGLLIGQPKEYPVRLMNELSRAFPTRSEIAAAYIAQTMREGEMAEPKLVIAIDTTMSEEDFRVMEEKLVRLAEALEVNVDFTRLKGDPLGEYLRSETKAFYQKV
jgi:hypothetical protein